MNVADIVCHSAMWVLRAEDEIHSQAEQCLFLKDVSPHC